MAQEFVVFSGSANEGLADAIAAELGALLGSRAVARFPDGETAVRLDVPVRGRDVVLIQPTAPPVNDNVIELLAFADACRRSAAARITAVVPYFGYARSDKRHARREPITASLVARLMQTAGIDQVVTLDLHADQIEGFFSIPVDNLSAAPSLCRALGDQLPEGVVVVSPDAGRVKAASDYAQRLGAPVVVLHKRRDSPDATAVTHVVGDVTDRPCLIIDDMISTGGTIARAVEALLAAGARREIIVAATHGLFVGDARGMLARAGVRRVVVTDSIAQSTSGPTPPEVVSIAPLFAAAIRRIHQADSSLVDLYRDAPAAARAVSSPV